MIVKTDNRAWSLNQVESLGPGLNLLSTFAWFYHIAGEIKGLEDDEDHGQSEHAEELEIDPGVTVIVAHDEEIGPAQTQKKDHPAKIQPSPYRLWQGQIGTQHPLNGRLFAKDLAGQKSRAEEPVNDGGLPLDELLVVKIEGQAAKDYDYGQRYQLHGRHLAGPEPGDGDLHKGGGNGDPGGHIDIKKFIGDKKKQDREKIKKEFHRGLGQSVWWRKDAIFCRSFDMFKQYLWNKLRL